MTPADDASGPARPSWQQWTRRAAIASLAGVLASAAWVVKDRAFQQHRASLRYEDVYYLPDADWLPVLSLGYRQALADVIWCRSLVYFGEQLVQQGAVRFVFEYTDAILVLDPSFRSAYRWAATAALYRPGEVSLEAGLRGSRYLKRAVERWPDDGELHWDYGSLLSFELAPLESDRQRKQELLREAAPSLEIAARLGAGPPWLALNSSSLLLKLGQTERAISHLEAVLPVVSEPGLRRDLERRLADLRATRDANAMNAMERTFRLEHQASYPYLSEGLFLLLATPDAGAPGGDNAAATDAALADVPQAQ